MVPAGDVEGAAASVNSLLADERRQIEIGERGRAFVQRYDYKNVAKEEMAALETVLPKHRKS